MSSFKVRVMLFVFDSHWILSFLANVSGADAQKWLESTGVSLLQDLVLKPALLASGYATLSTLVLFCNPRVKKQWIHPDEIDEVEANFVDANGEDDQNTHDRLPHEIRSEESDSM